ncbi:ParA family partition ATPase [Shewanella baltica]|uniref:ParA family partition ATPase n=1 Tax=Shewanella baltica TaxID=62322 RepID=UPI00217EA26C|nr:ParA family partition ATPase [Shewanella baltica]MCS6257486.1 AAA family ATPase [Shewanella baltica]MCS6272697.1 AAA family ATPase [Shewanella baltica]
MVKIVAIVNTKGGAGKTTTATNLACQLHSEGDSVILVDLDSDQGSASSWSAEQTAEDTFPVIRMGKNIARDLHKVAKGYDWAIIDGAPRVDELAALAVKAADLVIVPSTPSPYDVWASNNVVDIIKVRQEITDGKPKAAFLVTMVIKNTKLSKEVNEALASYDLPVFKAKTTRSVSYIETAKYGGSVIDLGENHPCAIEMRQIAKEVREYFL